MEAGNRLQEALARAVLRVLHALVRVLLRHGMPLPAFVDLAKRAYVDIALREFGIPGRKASASRVALLTGMTRKEVQRLLDLPDDPGTSAGMQPNRAARVVAGWVRDPLFHDASGNPRALELEGERGFDMLVRRYSGDVPTRAVLDELLRVGTVERDPDNRVRLLSRVYIPRASDIAKLGILGADVSYLIGTIDHNLQGHPDAPPRFQRKVMYDNVPVEALDAFRKYSSQQSQELIERLDAWLARNDRDTNPAVRGTGRMRVGVGIFAFEENLGETTERDG